MKRTILRSSFPALMLWAAAWAAAQIPLERVLSRVTVPSEGDLRGLVDTRGFPTTAAQMDFIGKECERLEEKAIRENQQRWGWTDGTALAAAVCPHDDYMIAARVYVHVQRYIKAPVVILVGNAHWSEAFGIRDRLIFGDFKHWRGPYGPVAVSPLRDRILAHLAGRSFTVNRKLLESEHSLEAMIPYLQFYNRNVEIVPVLVPYSSWENLDRLGVELAQAVAAVCREKEWMLGRDIAVLCSSDGQHYGDYGWSYYDYHPFGCDADGYKRAVALDREIIERHLEGPARSDRIEALYSALIDRQDISKYRVTWCGRFAVPFGVNFAVHLARQSAGRELEGRLLRHGTSLSDPWLPLEPYGLGLTSDTNLHHFVTYFAIGFR